MKEILYNFSKARARNAQHVQFATDVLAAVPEETATAQGFAPFYKHLIEAYANYCPDEVKKNAGRTLLFAIQEAGDVAKSDYASETAILSDLSAKLKQEPYAAALAEIGLSDAPTVIAEANDAFNAVYLKRSAEERDRKLGATMKTLRPVTDNAFNELAKAINALYAANELVTKDAEKSAALEKVIDGKVCCFGKSNRRCECYRGPLPQDYQHRFFGIGGGRAGGVIVFHHRLHRFQKIIVGAYYFNLCNLW